MNRPTKPTAKEVWEALKGGPDVGSDAADEAHDPSVAPDIDPARVAELDAAHVAELDDEALERELREQGVDPAEAAEVVLRSVRAEGPKEARAVATVPFSISSASRSRAWVGWLAAAAVLLVVLAAFAERRELEAWLHLAPEPVEPDHGGPPSPQEPTPRERAARLRDDAYAACAQSRWVDCRHGLDSAMKLDPAGESDPRVLKARHEVLEGMEVDERNDREKKK